jgi:hypothetical protein
MKRVLVAAIAAGVSVVATSANASPFNYTVNAQATYAEGTDIFTGTFSVDCVSGAGTDCVGGTEEVLSASIAVTGGGPLNGDYGIGTTANPATANTTTVTVINDAEVRDAVHFFFANSLNLGALDPITSIELSSTAGSEVFIETVAATTDSAATPESSATPLPAAVPLFATGLGTLGLLGWRRKRKAQTIA